MLPYLRTLLALVAVAALSACGIGKNKEIAGKAVEKFHQQFNDSKFAEIYASLSPDFKKTISEEDLTKMLQMLHTKLGVYKSGTQSGWNMSTATGTGTTVDFTYNSEFEHAKAEEKFTYVMVDEVASLQGFNFKSDALIEK